MVATIQTVICGQVPARELAMKEQPIIFSAPMVRAIMVGTKTQTRRVIKPQPVRFNNPHWPVTHGWREVPYMGGWEISWNQNDMSATTAIAEFCPYGKPGDHLWVRESVGIHAAPSNGFEGACIYRADLPDGPDVTFEPHWTPSIHMPRWASRITLEVISVRAQRLQEVTHEDGTAEGFDSLDGFAVLWDRINDKRGYGWQANPWVWAVEFKPTEVKPSKYFRQ